MSAMSSQRRKLLVGNKPSNKDAVKGDYMRWLKSAKAQLEGFFKFDEYVKHRPHATALLCWIRRERYEATD